MKLDDIQLKQILSDLYALDDGLKVREKELIEAINAITEAKPETRYSESFAARLRAEIIAKARILQPQKIPASFTYNFNPMRKLIYAAAGAALAILVIVPSFLFLSRPGGETSSPSKTGKKIAFAPQVSKVADNFFGRLGGSPGSGGDAATRSTAPVALEARDTGAEGAALKQGSAAPSIGAFGRGGGGGSGVAESAKLGIVPPYEFKIYRFVYKGGEFSVPSDKLDVLKRLKGASVSVNMPELVAGLNFGLADVGSFADLSVQNLTLSQKTDFGYMINVMPEEGSVNINQNWGYWPADKCQGDAACFENLLVRQEDIPADSELIGIADAFLDEHGIDRSVYGPPEVGAGNVYRIMYEASSDKANFYFPETIEVTYPYKIDDKAVYDEWSGAKQGLTVGVNVKVKKVSSVYNLVTQNYQSSAYEMETDVKKLLTYAEQGGINNYQYGEGATVEELELSDPELAYIRYYNYLKNENVELLVPAFVFPVKNPPSDPNFYRKSIVIPLAKDIIAERQPQGGPTVPTPVPLPAPDVPVGGGISPETKPSVVEPSAAE